MAQTDSITDTQIAEDNYAEFLRCYDARHRTWVDEANVFDDYFHDRQWTDAELSALGDRPAVTINISKKTISALYGHYADNRVDLVFKAVKDATFEQAQVVTSLADHILDANHYQMHESTMFLDGLIKDRGYLETLMDYEGNILGETTIRHRDPRDIVLDPEAKQYDPASWSQVFDIGWYSMDQLEQLYGRKRSEQVLMFADTSQGLGSESIRFGAEHNDSGPTNGYIGAASESQKKRIRSIRVIKRQYKKLGKVREFVDPQTLDLSEIPDHWTDERVAQIAEQYALMVRERVRERIRWTVSADRVLLFDKWSTYRRFTIIPFFPYFTAGKPTGVMRSLKSPQDQLNKAESQELHIVNTTANSGYFVEAGSLVNTTAQELEENGARTGIVIEYGKNRPKPDKIQPNQIPTGIDRIGQKAAQHIVDIPGAATLVGSAPSPELSGVVLERSQSRALLGLAPIMDNLTWTRHFLALNILDCIQTFYTEYRVMRVTDWRNPEQPQFDMEVNSDLLNNVTLGKYDVVVSTAPARDTAQDAQFAQAFQMREAGIMIPDYHVILSSNLHNKRKIAEESKKAQGLTEPSQEEQELQQTQQQIMMESAMAQLAELNAKAQDYTASAQLKYAQAQIAVASEQREAGAEQFDQQMQLQKMRADIAKQIATLMNKLELAGLHTQSKKELTRYTTTMKALTARRQQDSGFATAQMNAEIKLAQPSAVPRKSR